MLLSSACFKSTNGKQREEREKKFHVTDFWVFCRIKAECQFFGKAHTDYDFKAVDPKQTEAQVQKLAHEQQKLEGTINKKVASMISEADRKYQALQEKKSTVERDRSQILKTIEDLDHKKVKALEETYEQGNDDKIYSNFFFLCRFN